MVNAVSILRRRIASPALIFAGIDLACNCSR
jgi:hypothetical protein